MAITNTLLALGKLGLYNSHSLGYTNYPRSKNIHIFDFQNAKSEGSKANSGLDTTNGRHLRVELNFHDSTSDVLESPDDNTKLAMLKKRDSYKDTHLNTFIEFSKYIRINSSGILVVE
jgi:hypothetical protein